MDGGLFLGMAESQGMRMPTRTKQNKITEMKQKGRLAGMFWWKYRSIASRQARGAMVYNIISVLTGLGTGDYKQDHI